MGATAANAMKAPVPLTYHDTYPKDNMSPCTLEPSTSQPSLSAFMKPMEQLFHFTRQLRSSRKPTRRRMLKKPLVELLLLLLSSKVPNKHSQFASPLPHLLPTSEISTISQECPSAQRWESRWLERT